MAKMHFIMIGGFLGAGKTTTIARLARTFQEQGLNVGIVTNDQASDLVDTHNLRSQGFEVGEVAGACFCCNFNELTETASRLEGAHQPDVILAEPVGSCTDLIATVVRPLRHFHQDQFSVAPYGVILKPSHGLRILRNEAKAGFSPQAAYIFKKQLEEADFVILNRIDELSVDVADELSSLIKGEFPEIPVLRTSALTGQGFEALVKFLQQEGKFGLRSMEVDYDVYAEGEAELGWLNSSLVVSSAQEFSLDELLQGILGRLRDSLVQNQAETAHLKAIGMAEGTHAVANLISSETEVELSLPSECQTKSAEVVVNARVAIDPQRLEEVVATAIAAACDFYNAVPQFRKTQSFRPGRPVPTHRFAEVVD